MKKSLKSLFVLLIVIAFAATPLMAVFAEGEGETGGNEGEPETVKITYYNGDSQFGEPQIVEKGKEVFLRSNYPTKSGEVFTRWSTQGSTPSYYGPNQKVTLTEDLTLYASFVDKASGSEGISVVGPDGQKEMEFKYNGYGQGATFHMTRTSGKTYDQNKDGYFKFDEDEFYVSTAEWYADARYLNIGVMPVGIYNVPQNPYVQEWCQVTYLFGSIDVVFTAVEDKYIQVDPAVVKIYYEITYDANGGEGEIDPQKAYTNAAVLSDAVPTRKGMTFKGWATDKDATKAEYQPGEEIELDDNLDLYAVWEAPNPETDHSSDMSAFLLTICMAVAVMLGIRSLRRRTNN